MRTRLVARPNQLDLDSPGRRDYWVALEHDSIWGDHLIPLTVWVGAEVRAGEGLVAFGANHGNEYEGPMETWRTSLTARIESGDVQLPEWFPQIQFGSWDAKPVSGLLTPARLKG